ncbi:eukaryotic translation initiation factor 4B-like isoform X2 [Eurosta solidaginis]|uniref:eukaryotic translation initiation factor 4B-like isoform X2 n=1 Tax=Eurosta solidaginis TaxID=178769 RepID=UPI003530EF53
MPSPGVWYNRGGSHAHFFLWVQHNNNHMEIANFNCKKGKKKGTAISLQSFLANGDVPVGTTQVTKKVRNLEGEESDDGINGMPLVFQLPTAPRANRMFDDDSVPHNPPFIAYLTNLPFDAREDDLHEFFGTTPIVSLRLPREEGESGRVRGFGYIEFKNRDDLINTLSLPDPSVKGRRIRIELSNESEHQSFRQRGNRRGFDGLNSSGENRDSTNWRRENNMNRSNDNFDRSASREKKYEVDDSSWRSAIRTFTNQSTGYNNNDAERTKRNNLEKGDQEWERPKLNLKPRTLPLPIVISESGIDDERQLKSSDTSSRNVFGSAKPVDTASRESEIAERMSEARRQKQLKYEFIHEKKEDFQSEKSNKDNRNYTTSWRTKTDSSLEDDQSDLGLGMKKLETLKLDNRRLDKDDSRQTKTRNYGERDDKISQSVKRYTKNDNSIQKHQENTVKTALQTSNKYSGLDDEASA